LVASQKNIKATYVFNLISSNLNPWMPIIILDDDRHISPNSYMSIRAEILYVLRRGTPEIKELLDPSIFARWLRASFPASLLFRGFHFPTSLAASPASPASSSQRVCRITNHFLQEANPAPVQVWFGSVRFSQVQSSPVQFSRVQSSPVESSQHASIPRHAIMRPESRLARSRLPKTVTLTYSIEPSSETGQRCLLVHSMLPTV
jgi:hypothetical protein